MDNPHLRDRDFRELRGEFVRGNRGRVAGWRKPGEPGPVRAGVLRSVGGWRLKIEGTGQNDFYWQAGYAAFSQFADAEDRWHPEVGHCFERVASDDDVVCQTGNRISLVPHLSNNGA